MSASVLLRRSGIHQTTAQRRQRCGRRDRAGARLSPFVGMSAQLACCPPIFSGVLKNNLQTDAMRPVDIRSRFEETGVIRLPGAFATDQAAAMRSAIWQHAERQAG